MRVSVRVQPRAARTVVGGRYGTAEPPTLLIRVQAPAAGGRANQASIAALAVAFGVRRDAIRIVSGVNARSKIVEVEGIDPRQLATLLAT